MSRDSQESSYQNIVELVRQWPPAQRVHLVREILKTLESPEASLAEKRQTLAKAYGLLATGQPPPTDEEVQQWLEEARWEKYGK